MSDKLIEMAKAAGFYDTGTEMGVGCFHYFGFVDQTKELLKFAELIREDERYSQWQPIESAPKDGSFFDVWNSLLKTREANVWYCDGSFYVGSLRVATGATHWQPLPEPPKEKS